MVEVKMSDRDMLLSLQSQLNDYLSAVTPPPLPPVDVQPPPPNPIPVDPNAWIPSPPAEGSLDISDRAPHPLPFASKRTRRFTFTLAQASYVELKVVTVSGSYAHQVVDSGPGFANRFNGGPYFSPFTHQGLSTSLMAGTYTYDVALDMAGEFMVQANIT
jgi:hypothetical protein